MGIIYFYCRPQSFASDVVTSRLGHLPADVRADILEYLHSVDHFEAIQLTDRCFLVK